jgi:hypothetical protein
MQRAADGSAAVGNTGNTDVRDLASLGGITAEGLRETFRLWRIFKAGDVWWATRGGQQKWDGPESLLLCVLGTSGLTELAERLCLQEWLESLEPAELEAVYRGTLTGDPR